MSWMKSCDPFLIFLRASAIHDSDVWEGDDAPSSWLKASCFLLCFWSRLPCCTYILCLLVPCYSALSFLGLNKGTSWLLHPCALICRPQITVELWRGLSSFPLSIQRHNEATCLGLYFPVYLYPSCLILLQ